MGRILRFAVLVCVNLMVTMLLIACSSEERAPVDRGEEVGSQGDEATQTPPPETTAKPALNNAQANADLMVGETARTSAGNEVTVHSYESVAPADTFQPKPGFEFQAADVEGCAGPDIEGSAGFNPFDFALQMPDNTRLQSDIGVKEPPLNDTTLTPGDCVRGWVTFQVPEGETPTSVIYTASSIIKWAVEGVGQPGQTRGALPKSQSEGQSPEDVLTSQYEFINAGDYESAYALFDEGSKRAATLEQYKAFFEANAPYSVTGYSFPSVEEQGDTATVEAAFTVNSASGQEQLQRTQQLVSQGGEWRVVMRAEQVEAFTGADEPPEETQYGGGGDLSPNDQAAIDLLNCQSEEVAADLGQAEAQAFLEEAFDEAFANESSDVTVQSVLAERGYTCGGTAEEVLSQ